ncbi:DUF308 domain-containing protein [Kocuria atrinae]|uniref:DUF308 domain-containing protein n=1 Tax=Kocuria atrinae TaxID=592377 RepID=A0ABN2Y7V8_9MICC|nr:hypothetical protein [Kocuria sp.]
MSQQIPSPRGGASGGHRNGTDVRHDLWVPTLVRALVALVFGAVTIFWQEPTENAAPWALGLFLVGTGGAWLFLHFRMKGREDVDLGSLTNIPQLAGILYILGGALVAIMAPQNWLFVLLATMVLGLCGILELALGLRFRQSFPLGRDWTLSGLVTVGAGMGMMLVETLGAKAELGVVGGAAIIIGVTQFIAALSLRHDALAADRAGFPDSDRINGVD